MEFNRLLEKDIFDPELGVRYNLVSSARNTAGIHCHEFYEIFVMTQGKVIHNVNGDKQELSEGSMVFIRPDDVHFYEIMEVWDCRFINTAFTREVAASLFSYLGDDTLAGRLLSPAVPPYIQLAPADKNSILSDFEKLNTISQSDKNRLKTELRIFIFGLFTRCLAASQPGGKTSLPQWLELLLSEMQEKENFTKRPALMQKLSKRSPEHICREFRKHLGMTPTQYLNGLKLNYAKNLLVNTNEDIITVSLNSGFENLSHFYHLFKMQFKKAPLEFRKEFQKSTI